VPLRKEVAVLGRAHGNAVRIPSAQVSRQHCRLSQKNDLVVVRDLGSVNGTLLNGLRIQAEEVVRPGDKIAVGPVTFIVEYELTPAALEQLRSMHQDVDLLEALADGEILEVDEVDDFDEVEEVHDVEEVDDVDEVEEVLPAGRPKRKPTPPPVAPPKPDDDLSPLAPDFDFDAGGWQMPAGDDLRGLMDGFDDESATKVRKPKK
jgi:predicted component of type VI protein secretion system